MKKRFQLTAIRDIMPLYPAAMRRHTSIPDLKALFERYTFNAYLVVDGRRALHGVASNSVMAEAGDADVALLDGS